MHPRKNVDIPDRERLCIFAAAALASEAAFFEAAILEDGLLMPEGLAEEDIVSICTTLNNRLDRLGARVGDHVRFRLNDRVHKAWPASFGVEKTENKK